MKGVNRHETNLERGHAITREQMLEEVMLMKRGNINHVRNSHYPCAPYWYYLCDKYGIYLEDEANSAPTIRLVNSIIERAVSEQASDIHIEPRENQVVVRMRIDGVMRMIFEVPKDLQGSVISRMKIMCNMDISQHRIPQDGRCNVRVRQQDIDLRVSTLPTIYGEKIVLRLLKKSEETLTMEGIGLRGHNMELFNKLIHNNNEGVILIVGPTGSGKSSTMYTMVKDLNTEEVNLITLEDPVEYNINGVNQVQINEKAGLTFANTLRAVLRQAPDIVGVGENTVSHR